MSFALDVLTDTLNLMEADHELSLLGEEDVAITNTDWEESDCPTCGRAQDSHDQRMMTRCAMAAFDTRSTL